MVLDVAAEEREGEPPPYVGGYGMESVTGTGNPPPYVGGYGGDGSGDKTIQQRNDTGGAFGDFAIVGGDDEGCLLLNSQGAE